MISTVKNKVHSSLPSDVKDFFVQNQGSFGCMNLLPSHLPEGDKATELVKNVSNYSGLNLYVEKV